MKYEVYVDNNFLIFESKKGKTVLNIDDLTVFKIIKTKTDFATPVLVGKMVIHVNKKNPITRGTIIIGLKKYLETVIQKKNYKKIINEYNYIKIKNIDNVFDVAQKIIDYEVIHYDSVLSKEIFKIDNEGNKFYSYTKYIG